MIKNKNLFIDDDIEFEKKVIKELLLDTYNSYCNYKKIKNTNDIKTFINCLFDEEFIDCDILEQFDTEDVINKYEELKDKEEEI